MSLQTPQLEITEKLRGLTIHRPWAWAIMEGLKRVENRTWIPSEYGTIAIHAGHSPLSDDKALRCFRELGIKPPPRFSSGMILGTVEILEVLTYTEYNRRYGADPLNQGFAQGPYCWVLHNPKKCVPIPCSGRLQFWNVKKRLEQEEMEKTAQE